MKIEPRCPDVFLDQNNLEMHISKSFNAVQSNRTNSSSLRHPTALEWNPRGTNAQALVLTTQPAWQVRVLPANPIGVHGEG